MRRAVGPFNPTPLVALTIQADSVSSRLLDTLNKIENHCNLPWKGVAFGLIFAGLAAVIIYTGVQGGLGAIAKNSKAFIGFETALSAAAVASFAFSAYCLNKRKVEGEKLKKSQSDLQAIFNSLNEDIEAEKKKSTVPPSLSDAASPQSSSEPVAQILSSEQSPERQPSVPEGLVESDSDGENDDAVGLFDGFHYNASQQKRVIAAGGESSHRLCGNIPCGPHG